MIASRQPVFAKLGPKLERAGRERANLDAFLARYDTLPADRATAWGRLTAIAAAVHNAYDGMEDVLLALANHVDGALPTGDTAHQDLFDQMRADVPGLRPAVLDDDLDAARTEQNRMLMQTTFPKFVDAVRTLERLLTA